MGTAAAAAKSVASETCDAAIQIAESDVIVLTKLSEAVHDAFNSLPP